MGNIKPFRLNNLGGGINTKSEDGTLITVVPNGVNELGQITVRSEARDIENFNMLNRGGVTKTFGNATYFNTAVSTPITGMAEFIQAGITPVMLYAQGTKVYTLIGGVATDIGATITNGAYVDMTTANNSLIISDGNHTPQIWNGSSVSNMAGSPANFVQTVFINERVFGFADNSSILEYSDADNINSGYGSNFINCNKDDGQKITAIAPFFIPGTTKSTVMVAKERSVGIIDGSGTVSDPYTYKRIKADFGVPGFRQFVQFGQDIAFLTPLGVSSYDTSIQFVNIKEQFLSSKVQDKFSALDTNYIKNAIGFLDFQNNRIGYAVTESGFQYNNVIWFYDLVQGGWYKTRPNGYITSVLIDHNGTMYTASDAGIIYKWGTAYNAWDGAAISAYYKTPHLDFFEPYLYKRIIGARISLRGNGSYNLGIGTTIDYTRTGKSQTITLNSSNYTWGGGVWTSDPAVYQWGSTRDELRSFIPSGWFKTIQFDFSQTGANQPIDIYNMEFLVEFGDYR